MPPIGRSRGIYRGHALPTEWSVANFKSIDHAIIPLKPLTVLTGANSSGKSSLIQSLLLLSQSSDDEIILNGPLVRLGEPSDVIRSGCEMLTFSYSAETKSEDGNLAEWSFQVTLTANRSTLQVSEFDAAVDGQPVLSATSSRVSSSTKNTINKGQRYGDTILRVREVMGQVAPARTYLSFRGLYPDALILRSRRDRILAALRRDYSAKELDRNPELSYRLYEELQPWWREHHREVPNVISDLYVNFLQRFSLDKFSRTELDELFKYYADFAGNEEWLPVPISRYWGPSYRGEFYSGSLLGFADGFKDAVRGLAVAVDALRNLREAIRYLGPLREEPQVVSAAGGRNRSLPTGPKGEYTADLLAREKNSHVRFKDWNRETRSLKLPDAVSLWTTYLGVGDSVAVQDQGKLGRGLRLRINDVERDLTTVGVGASQLLPVITVVLAAEKGSVVCIEQPELHLHPAVQSRLADFFLWARPDISLIIETHSEYMITRIRRRSAEDTIDGDQISLLFAEQAIGVTTLRSLKLTSLGDLSDWPMGFFDTQDEETRAIVAAIANSARGGSV